MWYLSKMHGDNGRDALYLYGPESNQQSLVWKHPTSSTHRYTDDYLLALNVLSTCSIVRIAPHGCCHFCWAYSGIYVENDSQTLQELALDVWCTVSTYNKSWDRDIYNIWVDSHNKCMNSMGEYFENNEKTLYFVFFTTNCSVVVKVYNVKPM